MRNYKHYISYKDFKMSYDLNIDPSIIYVCNGQDIIQAYGVDFAHNYFYDLLKEKEKTMCDCKECKEQIKELQDDFQWLQDRIEKLEIITEASKYSKTYIKE